MIKRATLVWTAILSILLYAVFIISSAVVIYHGGSNRLTQTAEKLFPYPAAFTNYQIIPLSRFRQEVLIRENYNQRHGMPVNHSEIQRLVMTQLTNRILYADVLKQQHIVVTDKDVEARLQQFYHDVGGQDKLVAYLKQNYGPEITLDDFRLLTRELLSEAAIERQLLLHIEVRHILVALPDNPTADQIEAGRLKAMDIKTKITDPNQFATIAKQYSEDVSSRDQGGLLGTTVRGDAATRFSPDFENAIFNLPVNQVSDPIRSKYGWHIVLIDKKEGSINQSLADYTAGLRRKARIHLFIGK